MKIWMKFGLLFGIGMSVTMEVIFPLLIGENLSLGIPILRKCAIWLFAGLGLGYFLKITKTIKN